MGEGLGVGGVCRVADEDQRGMKACCGGRSKRMYCMSWRRRSVGYELYESGQWGCDTFCTCFYSTIWRGYRRALEYTDLWNMNPEDRANYVGVKFEREWQKEVKRAKW